MKNLCSSFLEKKIKKKKIYLIFSMLFLFLAIYLIISATNYKKEEKNIKYINMYDYFEEGSHLSNEHVYVDAVTKPYLFAFYKNNEKEEANKYYMVMDQKKKIYIVYMSEEKYKKVFSKDSNESVKIKGITKSLPTSIKDLAIDSYNKSVNEELLNYENFNEYLGNYYLDATNQTSTSDIYILLFILSIFISLILIFIYMKSIINNKKIIKNISRQELEKISSDLFQMENSRYNDLKLFFLDKYLVDLWNNIQIIKYQDIIWAYPYEKRRNGLLIGKYIMIVDKNNKKYIIANTKNVIKNKDYKIEEILKEIHKKNTNIILGYNKENKEKVIKIIKTLKNK